MAPHAEAVPAAHAAISVWDLVWGELERLITELNRVLAAHLRELPLAAWRRPRSGSLCGGVVVGRTRLELKLDIGGEAPALLRSAEAVLRFTALTASSRRSVAVLWVDPTTRCWTSTETEGELFPLDDRLALERFFLALFVIGD